MTMCIGKSYRLGGEHLQVLFTWEIEDVHATVGPMPRSLPVNNEQPLSKYLAGATRQL